MSSTPDGHVAATRLSAWLGVVPGSVTTWARRTRQAGFLGTTLLLAWEIRITPMAEMPITSTVCRLAIVLLLYVVGRWPQGVALVSLPLMVGEYYFGFHHLSATLLVPMAVAAVLITFRPRYRGYLYVATVIALSIALQPSPEPMADLASWAMVFLIPCVIGEGARYVLATIERIRHLTAAQLRRQRREVARELHDTSIHDITSLIMALERAKLRGVDDPELLAEIDHAAAMARQSVVSMRGVLNILREDLSPTDVPVAGSSDRAPATVEESLDTAHAALERAGHPTQVHIEDDGAAPLPYSVQVALVRVIQECTANMVKYATPGTSCAIMVERSATDTRALFINEYDTSGHRDPMLSSGLGLTGMRERAAAVGGSLTVSHDDHRWMVQATVPTIGSTTEGQLDRALPQ